MAELFANTKGPICKLAKAITNGTEPTITTTAAAPTPLQEAGGTFRIVIDEEIMIVTAGASTTKWTVLRSQESTVGVSHLINAEIFHEFTAGSANALAKASGVASVAANAEAPVTPINQWEFDGDVKVENTGGKTHIRVVNEVVWGNHHGLEPNNSKVDMGPALRAAMALAETGYWNSGKQAGCLVLEPGIYTIESAVEVAPKLYKPPLNKIHCCLQIGHHATLTSRAPSGTHASGVTLKFNDAVLPFECYAIFVNNENEKTGEALSNLQIETVSGTPDARTLTKTPSGTMHGVFMYSGAKLRYLAIQGAWRSAVTVGGDHATVEECKMGGWAKLRYPTGQKSIGNNTFNNCAMTQGFCTVYVEPGGVMGADTIVLGHTGGGNGPVFYKPRCSKANEDSFIANAFHRVSIEGGARGIMINDDMNGIISRNRFINCLVGTGTDGYLGGGKKGDLTQLSDAVIKGGSVGQNIVEGRLFTNVGFDPEVGSVVRGKVAVENVWGDCTLAIGQLRGLGLPFHRVEHEADNIMEFGEEETTLHLLSRRLEGPPTSRYELARKTAGRPPLSPLGMRQYDSLVGVPAGVVMHGISTQEGHRIVTQEVAKGTKEVTIQGTTANLSVGEYIIAAGGKTVPTGVRPRTKIAKILSESKIELDTKVEKLIKAGTAWEAIPYGFTATSTEGSKVLTNVTNAVNLEAGANLAGPGVNNCAIASINEGAKTIEMNKRALTKYNINTMEAVYEPQSTLWIEGPLPEGTPTSGVFWAGENECKYTAIGSQTREIELNPTTEPGVKTSVTNPLIEGITGWSTSALPLGVAFTGGGGFPIEIPESVAQDPEHTGVATVFAKTTTSETITYTGEGYTHPTLKVASTAEFDIEGELILGANKLKYKGLEAKTFLNVTGYTASAASGTVVEPPQRNAFMIAESQTLGALVAASNPSEPAVIPVKIAHLGSAEIKWPTADKKPSWPPVAGGSTTVAAVTECGTGVPAPMTEHFSYIYNSKEKTHGPIYVTGVGDFKSGGGTASALEKLFKYTGYKSGKPCEFLGITGVGGGNGPLKGAIGIKAFIYRVIQVASLSTFSKYGGVVEVETKGARKIYALYKGVITEEGKNFLYGVTFVEGNGEELAIGSPVTELTSVPLVGSGTGYQPSNGCVITRGSDGNATIFTYKRFVSRKESEGGSEGQEVIENEETGEATLAGEEISVGGGGFFTGITVITGLVPTAGTYATGGTVISVEPQVLTGTITLKVNSTVGFPSTGVLLGWNEASELVEMEYKGTEETKFLNVKEVSGGGLYPYSGTLAINSPIGLSPGKQIAKERPVRPRFCAATKQTVDQGLVAEASGLTDPEGPTIGMTIQEDEGGTTVIEI